MSILTKIKNFLEKEHISYQLLEHRPSYNAMETAEAQHIPGREMIKPVIVNVDGKLAMCVLPAVHMIDTHKLKQLLCAQEIKIVEEAQLALLFPGYEVGAMPPFGHLAGLKVYLDKVLEENETIAFNAGTHIEVIKMKLKDYLRLVDPIIADFGLHISQWKKTDA